MKLKQKKLCLIQLRQYFPNNEILLNGVLIPKLLNNPLASCSFINPDFLLPHVAHFDDRIALSFLIFSTCGSTFFCIIFAPQTA